MLRLQMYLPNALRKGVFESLPPPRAFNWFFFGKKFYDLKLKKPYLEVDAPCQFYCVSTGESYEVKGPTKVLIAFEGEGEETLKRVCERNGYDGYVRRREGPPSMEPPLPPDVTFWMSPGALTPVTNWEKCNMLRYASREPENSWKMVQALVGRVGVENASRLLYAGEWIPERVKNLSEDRVE